MTAAGTGADILFFLCLNGRGGAEISMLRLAEGLRARGRRVTAAVYGARPGLARESGFGGEIIDLGARHTAGAVRPLRRLLRGRAFSVVISALTHTNIAAVLAAPRGLPVVATEHGLDGLDASARKPLFALLARRAYRRATVAAASRALARRWEAASPGLKAQAIYNPVTDDRTPPAPPPAHEWLRDKKVVLGLGRLTSEKNFALLLRAFALLPPQEDRRLAIVGEGPERGALETLARELGVADRVLLPGFAPDPRGWLAHAALLVCPSEREGFGNVLVEALAEGVPVVSTDCPCGPAEILEDGRYGRLTPPGDAAALAQAMRAALDEKPDAGGLRARASAFTISRCVGAWLALIDSVCSAGRV